MTVVKNCAINIYSDDGMSFVSCSHSHATLQFKSPNYVNYATKACQWSFYNCLTYTDLSGSFWNTCHKFSRFIVKICFTGVLN